MQAGILAIILTIGTCKEVIKSSHHTLKTISVEPCSACNGGLIAYSFRNVPILYGTQTAIRSIPLSTYYILKQKLKTK